MSSELKSALGRALAELTRDKLQGEINIMGEELRGSVLAGVAGFAAAEAKALRAKRPDGKLTPEDLASIIEQIPAAARQARAAQED